jgi:hypothetical protein
MQDYSESGSDAGLLFLKRFGLTDRILRARRFWIGALDLTGQLSAFAHATALVGFPCIRAASTRCVENGPSATLAVRCGTGFAADFSPYQSTRLRR